MSQYEQGGNRYTAIFHKRPDGTLVRLPFDQVRFNVDINPQAERNLVPSGHDEGRIFEKVWITDTVPWKKKVGFGEVS